MVLEDEGDVSDEYDSSDSEYTERDEQNVLKDRTGRIWSTTPPAVHRREVQDIIKQQPCVFADGGSISPVSDGRHSINHHKRN